MTQEINTLDFILYSNLFNKTKSQGTRRKLVIIANKAIEEIADKGFNQNILSKVARETGYSLSKIKYYFSTEKELKIFCIKLVRIKYQAYVIEQFEKLQSPKERLRAYFKASIEWPQKNQIEYKFWIAFFHAASRNQDLLQLSQEMILQGRQRFKQLLYNVTLKPHDSLAHQKHSLLTHHVLRRSFESLSKEDDEYFIDEIMEACLSI